MIVLGTPASDTRAKKVGMSNGEGFGILILIISSSSIIASACRLLSDSLGGGKSLEGSERAKFLSLLPLQRVEFGSMHLECGQECCNLGTQIS